MSERRSIGARILAPLALLAAAGAVWLVLHGGVDSALDKGAASSATSTRNAAAAKAKAKARAKARRYTIRAGDTLSAIADRTGVPLEQIQALNPDLDPNALRTGQSITLTR